MTFVGQVTNSAGGSLTLAKPAGTVEDDLMVVFINTYGRSISGVPSGWTYHDSTRSPPDGASVDQTLSFLYKVAGSSEPANYVFTVTDSRSMVGAILVYRDLPGGGLINAYSENSGGTVGGTTTPTALSIITTVDSLPVLAVFAATNILSAPSGTTSRTSLDQGQVAIQIAEYTQGTAGATGNKDSSPYGQVWATQHVAISAPNADPNTPTNLQVTSDATDNTPVFSADISDPDSGQDIKGRFEVYESDGTTFVGTVDSSFRSGAGTVTAEYASALPVGEYRVQAATVDDIGAISAYTSQVTFFIKTAVEEDLQFIWDTNGYINNDLQVVWNTDATNLKDLQLVWNVKQEVVLDLDLQWSIFPEWVLVAKDPEAPVTWESVPS